MENEQVAFSSPSDIPLHELSNFVGCEINEAEGEEKWVSAKVEDYKAKEKEQSVWDLFRISTKASLASMFILACSTIYFISVFTCISLIAFNSIENDSIYVRENIGATIVIVFLSGIYFLIVSTTSVSVCYAIVRMRKRYVQNYKQLWEVFNDTENVLSLEEEETIKTADRSMAEMTRFVFE